MLDNDNHIKISSSMINNKLKEIDKNDDEKREIIEKCCDVYDEISKQRKTNIIVRLSSFCCMLVFCRKSFSILLLLN